MLKILFTVFLFQISFLHAVTLEDFRNNKEAFSRLLSKKTIKQVNTWTKSHRLNQTLLKEKSQLVLKKSIEEMSKNSTWCEINFITVLKKNSFAEKISNTNFDFTNFINYLRKENIIDDLLLEILTNFADVQNKLEVLNSQTQLKKSNPNSSDLYSSFVNWPTEQKSCLQDIYGNFLEKVKDQHSRNDSKFVGKLNYSSYKQGIISELNYEKIEVLRLGNINDFDLYLNNYIKNLNTVKDKLTNKPEEKTEVSFSETYVYRRSNLTRRGKLYSEYSNSQILLMSQLIEKTAKRIDAAQVHLYFQYDEENTDHEIYVFSPMEQYRIAVKMLRKDMAELRRSDLFKNSAVYYEDIIAAAFETGIITSKELNYVLEFDDLWNPKVSKWRGIANFSLSIAGTATFLLPTPFNYAAAIALIFTQSRLSGGNNSNNPEDNENVII